MTTFTEANQAEIKRKIIEKKGFIPVTVQTWFSALLRHGAGPYQGCLLDVEPGRFVPSTATG